MLRALSSAITLGLASPVFASGAPQWRAVDEATGQIRDVEGLKQLARDFPDSGTVRLRMLQPLLAAGEVERVMETLEWLYDRGYVFSDVAQEQIPKLLEGVDPGRIAERLRAEAEVIEASEVVATVPAEAGLVENVYSLGHPEVLAVTSIATRSVYISVPGGEWQPIPLPQTNEPSGILLDTNREAIWVSLGNVDGSNEEEPLFSGLMGIIGDFNNSPMLAAPEGVTPSDLTMGSDHSLYTSDPIGGGLYFAKSNDEALKTLIPPGTFRSPQGLVTSKDNSKLYVSDYRYGIAIIDLETREASRLASDIPVILDGVDGLWRYGNELIAVQNGTSPMRISAFELSKDGMRVVGHRVLEQAHSEWTEPLSGSIDGDALLYVGNGQWDRYFEGELKEGMEALPTQIRQLQLSSPAE